MSNTRRRTFTGGRKIDEYDPLEFELNGETFHCKPALPGAVLLEFVSRTDSDDGSGAAAALYSFFSDVMNEEEYKRFDAVVKADDVIIEMDLLGDIAAWLIEEYTNRPTEPSSSSEDGQPTSGPTSMAKVS